MLSHHIRHGRGVRTDKKCSQSGDVARGWEVFDSKPGWRDALGQMWLCSARDYRLRVSWIWSVVIRATLGHLLEGTARWPAASHAAADEGEYDFASQVRIR